MLFNREQVLNRPNYGKLSPNVGDPKSVWNKILLLLSSFIPFILFFRYNMFVYGVHATRSKFERAPCRGSPPVIGSLAEGYARLLEVGKPRAKPSDCMASINVYSFLFCATCWSGDMVLGGCHRQKNCRLARVQLLKRMMTLKGHMSHEKGVKVHSRVILRSRGRRDHKEKLKLYIPSCKMIIGSRISWVYSYQMGIF